MPTLFHRRRFAGVPDLLVHRTLWWVLYLSGGALAAAQQLPSPTAQAVLAFNETLGRSPTSAPSHAALASGVDLLRQRAEMVRALVHGHPEEVSQVRLPEATVARLLAADPGNARFLEQEVTLSGDVGQAVADDFSGNTAQTMLTLHDPATAEVLTLHAGGNVFTAGLLHRPVTVTGIRLGGDVALENVQPAIPRAASRAAASAVNPVVSCAPKGEQKTAVLVLQIPGSTPPYPAPFGTAAWWQQAITGSGSSVNALWAEMTRGDTFASVDVFGPLMLSQRYSCADFAALRTEALTRAAATVDLSRYNRIVLGFPAESCSFGGLATVGCTAGDSVVPHPYSTVWMPIENSYTAAAPVWAALAHELGHNLGLDHANTLAFGAIALGPLDFPAVPSGAGTVQGAVAAVNTEYGDPFSVMGNPWGSAPGPYSTQHRAEELGWLDSPEFQTVIDNGTFLVEPASRGSGVRALRVLRDAVSSSWLWLEYRDGSTPLDGANLAAVAGAAAPRGVTVRYENGYGEQNKTFLLDMAPAGTGGNNFAAGALLPGRSWSDPYSPLTFTVDSVSPAGASVTVRYDTPCASFSSFSGYVSANGGRGTVQVAAPLGCSWSASSNASWLTLGGMQNGTLTGSGDGTFTWAAAPNAGTSQRVTYITVGRVSRRLVQQGTGAGTFALTPANATAAPGAAVTLSIALAAPGGLNGLQTATLLATAPGQPPCSVTAVVRGGTAILSLFDDSVQQYTAGIAAGSSATARTAGCTLAGPGSGLSADGDTLTLALNLSFPAAGVRSLFAAANSGTALPVGLLTIGKALSGGSGTAPRAAAMLRLAAPAFLLAGADLRVTVQAAAEAGGAVPTGSVVLQENGATVATAGLQNGSAGFTVAGLLAGSHTFTATYMGDGNFAAASGTTTTRVVDFNLKENGTTGITVQAGAGTGNTASLTATGTANLGFPFTLALTCAGAPTGTTCTVTPGSGTPGAAPLPVTVTVTTTAHPSHAALWWLGGLPLAGLGRATRRRMAATALLFALCGCGSGISGPASLPDEPPEVGTPAGTNTLTIRAVATDGTVTLTHETAVVLRVE